MKLLNTSVVMLMIWILQFIPAVESAGGLAWASDGSRNRTRRDVTCGDQKYLHSGICCLNCPAGTYVKQHCTSDSQRGVCETCDFGLYTEHENGLSECLHCTKCRSDQDLVKQCSSSQNSRCQCKKGYFCLPDQACEICKTCAKCGEGEEVAKSCTATSNTVCRKQASSRPSTAAIVCAVLGPALGLILLVVIVYWKGPKCSKKAVTMFCPRGAEKKEVSGYSVENGQNDLNVVLEGGEQNQQLIIQSASQPVGAWTPVSVEAVEEEDRGLGESLPTTTASSQNSLCVGVPPGEPCPARCSPALPSPPPEPENEKLPRLIPINGEESLKRSFDLFEEMDVSYHSRFFRYIGLSDNSIKNAESLSPEDRVYELLKVWMEKEGMTADLNTLLEALLHLNQRLSAENILGKAISCGYYQYEEEE
ncbi:hematopoietic death receptor isoform X1 [Astyanax mexicanus]|uniref:hematopoietic death receptor isoform X1 n=1 Tax=Astyanax mexicanus TaxID=7994 RepID=UPI0020CAA54A|nr:hematopoietic death receptor isoform X1 [Astyanax mexicanus]